MPDTSILEKMTPLLREVFFDDDLVARPDMTAEQVHGWDSLGHVRLLAEVEMTFSIRFDATEVASLRSVGDLVDLIERKCQSRTS